MNTHMALKCIVLENDPDRETRHAAVQAAVRDYLKNDRATVVYSEKGRPSIEGAEPAKYIAVTTVEDKMLVAINDSPIGIDGEYLPKYENRKTDYTALAERFFSADEAEYVRDAAGTEDEPLRFLKVWTRKEAYVKCVGKTLADFPSFSVSDGERLLPKLSGVSLRKFSIAFENSEHYLFAIAGV